MKIDGTAFSEVYLDNTTMIGVAQLVSDPPVHLSAYTLVDLETFCEAFVLYDRVTSLRQGSHVYVEKSLSSSNLHTMRGLFRDMRAAGTFSTKYSGRGNGYPDGVIDTIVDELVSHLEPGDRDAELSVDSYLMKTGAFQGRGQAERARRTFPHCSFDIRPTCVYFATSIYSGKPYLASSIRVPIVRRLAAVADRKGMSTIQKCLEYCEAPMRQHIEAAAHAFDGIDLRLSLPPLMKVVLAQCKQPSEIPAAIAKTRERADVRRLRKWFGMLRRYVEDGDSDSVCRVLGQIAQVCNEYQSQTDSVAQDVLTVLTIGLAPLDSVVALMKSNAKRIRTWAKNRHISFLKDLASSTNCIKANRELIRNVFGVTLSDEDEKTFARLRELSAGN